MNGLDALDVRCCDDPVRDAAIAEAVACFGLTATGPAMVVARGAMGEISRVPTDGDDIALKRLFEWNTGESAPLEAAYADAARVAGVTVPQMLPAVEGGWVSHAGDNRWRASTWIEGEPLTRGECLPEAGAILGRLHTCGGPHPGPMNDWRTTIPSRPRLHELSAGDARMRSWVDEACRLEVLMGPAPTKGLLLCHSDFAISNLLRLADGTLAVLDLEDVGPMPVDHEVGSTLLGWAQSDADVRELRAGYGPGVRLTVASFRTSLCRSTNFLAVQAEAVRDSDVGSSDHAFGLAAVERLLRHPWDESELVQIASAWNEV